jgi:hypothetical protein
MPKGVDPQNVGHHGQAVSVPADHLKVGFDAVGHHDGRGRCTGHAHHGGLVVGDIDGVDHAPQVFEFLLQVLHIGALGRSAFPGKRKVARLEYFLQVAS